MARNNHTLGETGITDLSLLRHFVTVVNSGSFTRASQELNLSQSAVSRSVSRLEDILGTSLLERTTRKLQLTPAGRALYAETTTSLDRISVALADARRIGQGASASLRIGICQSAAVDAKVVQRALQAFRHTWPQVELKLTMVIGAFQPDALRASELDLGIMQRNRTTTHGLETQILTRRSLSFHVPKVWGLNSQQLQLADLHDRPWIMPDPKLSESMYQHNLAIFRAAGFEPIIGGYADDILTGQIMLACGLGAVLSHAWPDDTRSQDYTHHPINLPGNGDFAETIAAWASATCSEQLVCLVECLREAATKFFPNHKKMEV